MKKKSSLLLAMAIFATTANAQVYGTDEKNYIKYLPQEPKLVSTSEAKPFLSGQEKFCLSEPGANWFATVKFGVSLFNGAPLGCGDAFDRMDGLVQLSLGKWHSRFFGTRVVYQGWGFKDSQMESMTYHNLHGDLMLNVSSFFRSDYAPMPKWNLTPYVGFGVIRNSDLHTNPFALSYGLVLNHRVADRIYIEAELGGTSTYQRFDGIGKKDHFGDNLFQASLGVNIGIGKQGFKRKRVLEVLNTGDGGVATDMTNYPRNDFKGLRDLMERLGGGEGSGDGMSSSDSAGLDAPILFFFKINTTNLVDKQQLVNIKEIAGAVMEYGLKVRIIGAADSRTGSVKHNRALSIRRTKYIAKLLMKAGVPKDRMEGISRGGIDLYKPYTANRHTCVILYK